MPESYWHMLGRAPTEDRVEIDRAYRAASAIGASPALHYAWKLLRDPYYRTMHTTYDGEQAFREAGFFDDGLDTDLDAECYSDPNWLTTPYHKILSRLRQLDDYDPIQWAAYPPVVLLSTGGFSPIHNGHIDMMELAKNEMIQKGHLVLGGYLSPSHDSYVSTKHDGAAALLDAHRIRLCHEAVASNEWIMVDAWEARYVPCAINYTDVILRLKRYLNHHLGLPVPLRVVYVFGGDNAAFARAFLAGGHAVCIERPGYEARVQAIRREVADAKERILFARPRLEYFNISSSGIRSEEMVAMPERTSRYYTTLKESVSRAPHPLPMRRYLVRDDRTWSVQPWLPLRNAAELAAATRLLLDSLTACLCKAFSGAPLPDQAITLRMEVPSLDRQAAYANALRRESKTITLDNCTEGTQRLEVSRLFGLADGQCYSTQLTQRPGFPAITEQLLAIPAGDYELIDDDIASGRTMRMVMAAFPPEIRISKVRSLLEQTRTVEGVRVEDIDYQDFYDVVDFRDFLFGSRSGGLVTRLPDGELARVPYLAPYVTLSTRARIPASQEIAFSRSMWRANVLFFRSIKPAVRVEECDPPAQQLMRFLGFAPTTPVLDVVQWHVRMLEHSTSRF